MENPVFRLEKVVHSRSEPEPQDFEGPLDLILFLLGKNRMEIREISIALICDQYLHWLASRQGMDLEVASEFVTMASHLVYLKTRTLLAQEDAETQSELDALMESLEERRRSEQYQQMKEQAQLLGQREPLGREILTRPPEPMGEEPPPLDHCPEDLLRAFLELGERTQRLRPPPRAAFCEIAQHEAYPVEAAAQTILSRLQRVEQLPLSALFPSDHSRSEMVATFLAVLELCRAHRLSLDQDGADWTLRGVAEEEGGVE